ncbi:hypothetical protein [Roseinatronobacter monicus]|uniref:hypothetical protein n=1 Tax=Roseinatronobacter monicus TaxID=393481 RepID=UPI003F3CB005
MAAQPRKTWHLFDTAEDAIEHRRTNGTGGWIFEISDNGEAVLFPWQMTPSEIFRSVFVVGRVGRLIGTDGSKIMSYGIGKTIGL